MASCRARATRLPDACSRGAAAPRRHPARPAARWRRTAGRRRDCGPVRAGLGDAGQQGEPHPTAPASRQVPARPSAGRRRRRGRRRGPRGGTRDPSSDDGAPEGARRDDDQGGDQARRRPARTSTPAEGGRQAGHGRVPGVAGRGPGHLLRLRPGRRTPRRAPPAVPRRDERAGGASPCSKPSPVPDDHHVTDTASTTSSSSSPGACTRRARSKAAVRSMRATCPSESRIDRRPWSRRCISRVTPLDVSRPGTGASPPGVVAGTARGTRWEGASRRATPEVRTRTPPAPAAGRAARRATGAAAGRRGRSRGRRSGSAGHPAGRGGLRPRCTSPSPRSCPSASTTTSMYGTR